MMSYVIKVTRKGYNDFYFCGFNFQEQPKTFYRELKSSFEGFYAKVDPMLSFKNGVGNTKVLSALIDAMPSVGFATKKEAKKVVKAYKFLRDYEAKASWLINDPSNYFKFKIEKTKEKVTIATLESLLTFKDTTRFKKLVSENSLSNNDVENAFEKMVLDNKGVEVSIGEYWKSEHYNTVGEVLDVVWNPSICLNEVIIKSTSGRYLAYLDTDFYENFKKVNDE